MDEQDRTPEQGPVEGENSGPVDRQPEGEGVPIPARLQQAVDEVRQRVKQDEAQERDIVREYEERYYGSRKSRLEAEPPSEQPRPAARFSFKPQRRFASANVDANERKWAALAHASTLLTALVALPSLGSGVLLTIFVPLLIYFAFRKRSEYVAFHSLQAFTIQLVGTIGTLALLIVGPVVGAALMVVLALTIVGIVLIPLVIVALVLVILVALALPLAMVIYAAIATFETYHGHDYRFPYIGRWVENQMEGGLRSAF